MAGFSTSSPCIRINLIVIVVYRCTLLVMFVQKLPAEDTDVKPANSDSLNGLSLCFFKLFASVCKFSIVCTLYSCVISALAGSTQVDLQTAEV